MLLIFHLSDRELGIPDTERRAIGQKDQTSENVNSQKIKINKKTNVVTLEKNMKIDLGGIAKGYTSQRIAKIYKKDGVKSGVISLGDNVQAIGTKTDGMETGGSHQMIQKV